MISIIIFLTETIGLSTMHETFRYGLLLCITLLGVTLHAAQQPQKGLEQIIFEERRIEGKIRRPQLVLIKAEQRPEFEPMVIQSLGKTGNIVGAVNKKILERSPYDGAFVIEGRRITNYVP